MSKAEEILKKHFGAENYTETLKAFPMDIKAALAAMEEYAQQQPSAPLSSLPDWKDLRRKISSCVGTYENSLVKGIVDEIMTVVAPLQAENQRLREQLQAAQPPAAEEVVFGKVFEWLHEWGLKPSGNIRYAGQWQDGVGNYYTVEQLKEFFDRDTKTEGGNQ